MALTRAEKQTELTTLESELRAAQSAILLDFKGLNVPQVTELRRQVRADKGRYRVVKNTLVKRALKGTPFAPLSDQCVGATALAYTGGDPVALAKVLTTFIKTAPALSIVMRSAPEVSRSTFAGSGTPATCPSSSVTH